MNLNGTQPVFNSHFVSLPSFAAKKAHLHHSNLPLLLPHPTLLFVAVFVTMVSFWGAPTALGVAIATLMVLMMLQQARGHTMHTRPILPVEGFS